MDKMVLASCSKFVQAERYALCMCSRLSGTSVNVDSIINSPGRFGSRVIMRASSPSSAINSSRGENPVYDDEEVRGGLWVQ